jgi:hypothetical protein
LVTNICHHIEEDEYDEISDIELERSVHRVLLQLSNLKQQNKEFDHIEKFHEHLGDEFGTDATNDYTVVFPLNIPQDYVDQYGLTFKAYGVPVRPIDFDEGTRLLENVEEERDRSNQETLKELLDQYPISKFTERYDHSFWEISLSENSIQSVITTITRTIRTVIGKINYTEYGAVETRIEIDVLLDGAREGRNCVMPPLFYLLFSEGNFRSWRSDETLIRQDGIYLSEGFDDEYSLRTFPHEESRSVDENIASALREFGMGVAAQSNRNAFLHYWQALEEATLIDEYAGSKEPLNRLEPFVTVSPEGVYSNVVEWIAKKRNRLIHSGKNTVILVKDVELLHYLVSVSIDSLYELRSRDVAEIRGIMKYGDKSKRELDHIITQHEDEISDKETEIDSSKVVLSEARAARKWRQERS